MKKYHQRFLWYFSLFLITAGFLGTGNSTLLSAYIPALLTYLPISLIWVVCCRIIFKFQPQARTIFGISTEKFSIATTIAGLGVAFVSMLYQNIQVASLGMGICMCGADSIYSIREIGFSVSKEAAK
ncbi:hypothetical protein [Pandoraea terrae]|nr:hypothetical protein [Pandoraea terrae]